MIVAAATPMFANLIVKMIPGRSFSSASDEGDVLPPLFMFELKLVWGAESTSRFAAGDGAGASLEGVNQLGADMLEERDSICYGDMDDKCRQKVRC